MRSDQWHLSYLNTSNAQRITRGAGVTVAVPDTGVQPHPDLRRNLLRGTDIIAGGDGSGQYDQNSHGTGMAGLIAAHGQGTNSGALGIAPDAQILPIRDTPVDGEGKAEDLAAGIDFAVLNGADVISISSVGGAGIPLRRSIRAALAAGVIVVASSGNRPQDSAVGYPASEDGVIAVGGIDRDGKRAAVSVTGPEIDVVAPAVDIYSTSIDGKYRKGTGTSDATAIVAGAAALIRSKYPYLPAREVAHRLTATAVDKGPPGRDDEYGYGVIDLVAALTADVPPLGFESVSAPAGAGPTTTAGAQPGDESDSATARGLATLGVLVAAGVGWAVIARRRRHGDDPPPRISR
ncbi:type VII secretion-associated serine protease mycosin [Micromonospora sp. NBC_00362]|uniref:type VII secretion-associated serine protease mycosin n=1 Tax=Micromonospora sp. NBC_00362 TaxID=2975975 RepID=UPI00224F9470|nr:type VII secretion-associated serine protease mycosin [Micromonospora sp. NBC_00362]MCX5118796.1 type VII secretion-associated serine protease mycosin [Micromonospora sp. NBC_00362]